MQWDFDDIPVTIRLDDGTLFRAGCFAGRFEIDEIGLIQRIWLDEHVWPASNKSCELRRWRKGDPAPGFKTQLFDALVKNLSTSFEEEINECLADIHDWPSVVDERERDRAYYHAQVL